MKRWMTALLALALVITCFLYYQRDSNYTFLELPDYKPKISLTQKLEVEEKSLGQCNERQNFVFIKTHKTGTSTTVNILYNFGMTRGLNYAVYPYTHQLWAIEQSRLMTGVNYNIMCQHMIFNYNKIHNVMSSADTYYFTLLREPVRAFISFFIFYKHDNRLNMELGGDQSLDTTINEFLNEFTTSRHDSATNKMVPVDIWQTTGRYPVKNNMNSMSYDVGMIGDSSSLRTISKAEIEYYIAKLDTELDFVMLLEHLDESLVLLGEDMCWTNSDLYYINRMQSNSVRSKEVISDATRERLTNFLQPDILLYNHFKAKLLKRLDNRGTEFSQRVDSFKKERSELEESCLKTDVWIKGPYGSKSHPLSQLGLRSLHCAILVERDTTLTKILSLQQDPDEQRRQKYLKQLTRPADYYHNLDIARKDKLKP